MLVNVSGAETQNQITGVNHVTNVAMHPFQARLISDSAMSMRDNFVDDELTGDSRHRRFIRAVNIRHHHAVGIIKGGAELFAQRRGAGITMRLKQSENAFATN